MNNFWFHFRVECLEIFLSRAFMVNDRYSKILSSTETDEYEDIEDIIDLENLEYETDHAFDVLLGYQEIVFRAVYFELNALIESELKSLTRSIMESKGISPKKLNRGEARNLIEREYQIKLKDLPRYDEIDEIRKIANAFKHDEGFTGEYEELFPNAGWLFGYKETMYNLDESKAYQSIQAVKEFMRVLPGDRQGFPGVKFKSEDEVTFRTRRMAANYLKESGFFGHDLDDPVTVIDGGFTAKCKLCGKSIWHENEYAFIALGALDKCPGIPELRKNK